MFSRLSLKKKLLAAFFIVLMITSLVGGVAIKSFVDVTKDFKRYEEMSADLSEVGKIKKSMEQVEVSVLEYFLKPDERRYKLYLDKVEAFKAQTDESKGRVNEESRIGMIDEIVDAANQYESFANEVISKVKSKDSLKVQLEEIGPEVKDILVTLADVAGSERNLFLQKTTGLALQYFIEADAAAFKFIFSGNQDFVDIYNTNMSEVERYIRKMNEDAVEDEETELIEEISTAAKRYRDVFSQMMTVNETQRKLSQQLVEAVGPSVFEAVDQIVGMIEEEKSILGPQVERNNQRAMMIIVGAVVLALICGIILALYLVKAITGVLQGAILQAEEGAKEITDAVDTLRSVSHQLSSNSSEQASSIEETSASLEEINGMVENNISHAESALDLSNQVKDISGTGNESMKKLQESMGQILAMNEEIVQLVRVINDIGERTKVMDDIVFQTRLLSFNASVEAERAGEYGRGFAVVAQEVGNLAQMSGKAAKEIAEIVESSTVQAEKIALSNKEKVSEGNKIVAETAKILQEVVGSSVDVSNGSNQVLTASKDQAKGIKQISTAITQLEKAMQQNTSIAEQTSATTENLGEQIYKFNGIIEDLITFMNGGKQLAKANADETTDQQDGEVIEMESYKSQKAAEQSEWQPMDLAAGGDSGSATSDEPSNQSSWESL